MMTSKSMGRKSRNVLSWLFTGLGGTMIVVLAIYLVDARRRYEDYARYVATQDEVMLTGRMAIVIANDRGEIVTWSPVAEELTGWAPEEIVGEKLSYLVPDMMRTQHEEGFQRAAETESLSSGDAVFRRRCKIRRKDSVPIDVNVTVWLRHVDYKLQFMAMIEEIEETEEGD